MFHHADKAGLNMATPNNIVLKKKTITLKTVPTLITWQTKLLFKENKQLKKLFQRNITEIREI